MQTFQFQEILFTTQSRPDGQSDVVWVVNTVTGHAIPVSLGDFLDVAEHYRQRLAQPPAVEETTETNE